MVSAIFSAMLLFCIVVAGNSAEPESIVFANINEKEHAVNKTEMLTPKTDLELLRQELEKMREDTKQETAVLRQNLDTLKTENDILKQQLLLVKEEIGLNRKGTMKSRHKRLPIEAVAFHAYQDREKCINNLQTFVYDNVLINDGNGYSANDGIFDAPQSGVYVFTWSVAVFHDYYAAELIVNGVSRGATVADNDSSDIAVGTAVVVIHVQAGSHVYVRRSTGAGCQALNRPGTATNSFTGWLLYPTEP